MGLLVAGGVTSKLLLVYVAIALSAVALIFLVIGAILHRGEFRAQPSGGTAGTAAGTAAGGACRRTPRPRLLPLTPARRLPALRWPAEARAAGRGHGHRHGHGYGYGAGGGHRKTTLARFTSARRTRPVGCLRAHRRPAPPGRSAARRPADQRDPVGPAGRGEPGGQAAGPRSSGQAGDCRTNSTCTLPGPAQDWSAGRRRPEPRPPEQAACRSASPDPRPPAEAPAGQRPSDSGAGHVRLATPARSRGPASGNRRAEPAPGTAVRRAGNRGICGTAARGVCRAADRGAAGPDRAMKAPLADATRELRAKTSEKPRAAASTSAPPDAPAAPDAATGRCPAGGSGDPEPADASSAATAEPAEAEAAERRARRGRARRSLRPPRPSPRSPRPPRPEPAEPEPAKPELAGASEQPAGQPVTVVPGVPRYHRSDCILIRFMGDNDLQKMPVEAAREAGCTPCRACQPDGAEAG